MARLVLLNVSILLLLLTSAGFQSTSAWPYPDDLPEKLNDIQEEAMAEEQMDEEVAAALAVPMEDESTEMEEQLFEKYGDGEDTAEVAIDYSGLSQERAAEISQAGSCSCDLIAYDKSSFRGRSLLMRQQNANFRNDYFNNRIESVKVRGKCQWLLYQNTNFDGKSYIVSPGQSYSSPSRWGGRGDRLSSARALPAKGTRAIVLFQHANYRGRMLVLYGSNPNLPAIDFNDQLSSFIIIGGRWTLYQHTSYCGKSVTLGPGKYTSASALSGAGGNNKISSIKALK